MQSTRIHHKAQTRQDTERATNQGINTEQMNTIGQQITDRTGAEIGTEPKQQVKWQNKQKHMTGNLQHMLRREFMKETRE